MNYGLATNNSIDLAVRKITKRLSLQAKIKELLLQVRKDMGAEKIRRDAYLEGWKAGKEFAKHIILRNTKLL